MKQFLLILTVLLFGVSHAAAAPSALCRHANVDAHVAASQSADEGIATAAQHEEAAAAASKEFSSLSDKLFAEMTIAILPGRGSAMLPELAAAGWLVHQTDGANARTVVPLLRPPLTQL